METPEEQFLKNMKVYEKMFIHFGNHLQFFYSFYFIFIFFVNTYFCDFFYLFGTYYHFFAVMVKKKAALPFNEASASLLAVNGDLKRKLEFFVSEMILS